MNTAKTIHPQTRPNLECFGMTDTGLARENNQDQFLIADLHKNIHVNRSSQPQIQEFLFGQTLGKLLVVADGVGGNQAGEIASDLAIKGMAQYLLNSMHWLFRPTQADIDQFVRDLKAGAIRSHRKVLKEAEKAPDRHGMGSTLTVAYLIWPHLYVLHVGDSRCYLLREGKAELITKDQTLAQDLYDRGHLSDAEFAESPYHNVLTSAIGANGEPDAVVYKVRLQTNDRLLLCSDGINKHLTDAEIEAVLGKEIQAEAICQELIDTSNQRGGLDNLTCVVARLD